MDQAEGAEPRTVSVREPVCQLALLRAVDDVLDELIVAGAGKVALLRNNRQKRSNKLALSRSQLKNVVNEATGTRSQRAVTNFIRYQMGRKDGEAWRHPERGRAFGRELIADIEGDEGQGGVIGEAARKVCDAVGRLLLERGLKTDDAELEREARAQLTARYLGYLNRTYAYCEKMEDVEGAGERSTCWDDVGRIAGRGEGGQ